MKEVRIQSLINSVHFSSNRIFPNLVLSEIIRRSTVEDTSYRDSTFSVIAAIP